MSEKIVFVPGKVGPVTAKPGGSATEHSTHSRSFAEMLAEAEAVQDLVELRSAHRGQAPNGRLAGALQGIAGMLLRPLPRMGLGGRMARARRETVEN
jgi:hypothetical protein